MKVYPTNSAQTHCAQGSECNENTHQLQKELLNNFGFAQTCKFEVDGDTQPRNNNAVQDRITPVATQLPAPRVPAVVVCPSNTDIYEASFYKAEFLYNEINPSIMDIWGFSLYKAEPTDLTASRVGCDDDGTLWTIAESSIEEES